MQIFRNPRMYKIVACLAYGILPSLLLSINTFFLTNYLLEREYNSNWVYIGRITHQKDENDMHSTHSFSVAWCYDQCDEPFEGS